MLLFLAGDRRRVCVRIQLIEMRTIGTQVGITMCQKSMKNATRHTTTTISLLIIIVTSSAKRRLAKDAL